MPDSDRYQTSSQRPGLPKGTQPLGRQGTRPLGTMELPAAEVDSLLVSAGETLTRLAPTIARLVVACLAAGLALPGVEPAVVSEATEDEVRALASILRADPEIARRVQMAIFHLQEAEKARAQTLATRQRTWAEALKRHLYLLERLPEELAMAPAIAALFGPAPAPAAPLDTRERLAQKSARQAVLVRAEALASRLESPLALLARAIAPGGPALGGWLDAEVRQARLWGFKLANEDALKSTIREAGVRHQKLVSALRAAWEGEPLGPLEAAVARLEESLSALQASPLVRELFPAVD